MISQLERKIIKKFQRFNVIMLGASGSECGWVIYKLDVHVKMPLSFFLLFCFLFIVLGNESVFFYWIIVALISKMVFFLCVCSRSKQQLSGWKENECCVSTSISHDRMRYSSTESNDSCALTICFSCKLWSRSHSLFFVCALATYYHRRISFVHTQT